MFESTYKPLFRVFFGKMVFNKPSGARGLVNICVFLAFKTLEDVFRNFMLENEVGENEGARIAPLKFEDGSSELIKIFRKFFSPEV